MKNSGFSSNAPGAVSGVFFSKKDADNAFDALVKLGHTPDDISVLMSDETLSRHESEGFEVVPEKIEDNEPESALEQAKNVIASAIISITTMVSLPDLGIAISNTLLTKLERRQVPDEVKESRDHALLGSGVQTAYTDSYHGHMMEGGIIISTDPKNLGEKKAIVRIFRDNNGHDILSDDGYTELD